MSALLIAGAIVVLLVPAARRRVVERRLARLGPDAPKPDGRRLRLALALVLGLAVPVLAGRWWGVPAGVLVGFGVERLLRRIESGAVRAARLRTVADLPLGADLL